LVEAAPDRAVIWTKPDDLKIDAKEPTAGLLDEHAAGFNVVFADASVRFLSAKIDPKTLNALFTRNGGEVIKSNEW
ncbi:MAG TPA: H-X9-DG-CTERM domain-containing protein, partial [Gemmataceae bacterium]|nr:H-X9-DG-CTERM domain-containing protein [Gemmataceae bacterium]